MDPRGDRHSADGTREGCPLGTIDGQLGNFEVAFPFGFHIGLAAPIESFDVHAYAVLSSPDLRSAYRRACRYQRLIHETTEFTLEESEEEGVLRHQLPGGRSVPRQPAEFLATTWLRFGRLVTDSEWQPSRLCFDHSTPEDASELRSFFGAGLQFRSGRTAMHIPARY